MDADFCLTRAFYASRAKPTFIRRFSASRAAFWLPVFFCCLMACGCAGKVDTRDLRAGIASGNVTGLRSEVENSHSPGEDFEIALNLGRLRQMEGKWEESIAAYNEAAHILREYEERAVVNIRGVSGDIGMFTLARGAKGYFGAGYERSLLHTMNSLNYLMLGDLDGAAVELRKMERRQEIWLAESAERLQKAVESAREAQPETPDALPAGYSMRAVLQDAVAREIASTYQDPFSYTLSATVCRLARDPLYAEVSEKRALALDPLAAAILRPEPREEKPQKSRRNRRGREEARQAAPPPGQEVLVIVLTGLAPSLYIERVRFWAPAIGSVMLDLPSYHPPVKPLSAPVLTLGGRTVAAAPLLHADLLAYRNLWDELRFETAAAISRAGTRAGIAAGVFAVTYANKDTRPYSGIAGALTSLILDLATLPFDQNVRNWETLPCTGYLARFEAAPASELTVAIDGAEQTVLLPPEGKTVVVLVSYITAQNMRIDYAAY